MLDYELKGRQVALAIDPEILPLLRPLGIHGSPTVATVHAVEDDGLWLDNPAFDMCPPTRPRTLSPEGRAVCHAHVFVPRRAIVALAAFPEPVDGLEESTELHRIGFILGPKKPARK